MRILDMVLVKSFPRALPLLIPQVCQECCRVTQWQWKPLQILNGKTSWRRVVSFSSFSNTDEAHNEYEDFSARNNSDSHRYQIAGIIDELKDVRGSIPNSNECVRGLNKDSLLVTNGLASGNFDLDDKKEETFQALGSSNYECIRKCSHKGSEDCEELQTHILNNKASGSGCCFLNTQSMTETKDKVLSWFPYTNKFKVGNATVSSSHILQWLDGYIENSRKLRIKEVARNRTYAVCLVVEGLADFGNISAVFRTADAFGFQSVHVISNDNSKRYKQNRNVSMGSEKWLDIEQWESTRECFNALKLRGYRIAVTHVASDTVSIHKMDWMTPTAIVLGNELKGISSEALELADIKCSIPMYGMVDSFNVSVAAGIFMHTAAHERASLLGSNGDLNPEQCQVLTAEFYLRHRKSMTGILDQIIERYGNGNLPCKML